MCDGRGDRAGSANVALCMASIAGQCLFYYRHRMCAHVLKNAGIALDLSRELDMDAIDVLARHITDFSLGGVKARRAKK